MKEIVRPSVRQSQSPLVGNSVTHSLDHSATQSPSHSVTQSLSQSVTHSLRHRAYLCFVFSTHCLFTLATFCRKSCKVHPKSISQNNYMKEHPRTSQPSLLSSSSLSAPMGFRLFFLEEGLWRKNVNNNEWPSNARQFLYWSVECIVLNLVDN